jgi:hypothetical protein
MKSANYSKWESVTRPALLAIVVAAGLMLAASAHAQTFAEFDEAGGTNPFTFTNGGTSASFSAATQVNFQFLLPGDPLGLQAATMTLTSTAVTQSQVAFLGPFELMDQPIDGATNTLTFTRNSDGANLLTVSFTGDITGFYNDVSAALSGDTASGNTVTYTSDFINFSATTDRSLQLQLSGIDPAFTQNSDGFADNFTATATGGFSATGFSVTPVPEPGTWLFGGALLGACIIARRRTRVSA